MADLSNERLSSFTCHTKKKSHRSMSVPRTKHEIKRYRVDGFVLQRSRVNHYRLRRRDIMTNSNSNESDIFTESSSSNQKPFDLNIKMNCNISRQKSKLIKRFQRYSKKIEDKFRKKYRGGKNKTNHQNQPHNTNSDPFYSVHNDRDNGRNRNKQLTITDVCFDFQNHGQCKRGDSCRYQHIAAAKSLCLDWKNGGCPRGDVCRFAHRYDADIVEPKKYRNVNKSNEYHNIHNIHNIHNLNNIHNTHNICMAPLRALVIPTRTTIQTALPKIIQTNNGLNNTFARNISHNRTPIAVIVRDTNKDRNRNRNVTMNQHRYMKPSPLMPHHPNHTPITGYSAHSIPFHPNHYSTSIECRESTIHPNQCDTEMQEFDFQKLGDQIQSNIQRSSHSSHSNIYPYKLAPHPPPQPPRMPRGYAYNPLSYSPCSYKYDSSSYFYHQENNNNNNINNSISNNTTDNII